MKNSKITANEMMVVFNVLIKLPPGHSFWRNKWCFTRPVFTQESLQGKSSEKFLEWVEALPGGLRRHIMSASTIPFDKEE